VIVAFSFAQLRAFAAAHFLACVLVTSWVSRWFLGFLFSCGVEGLGFNSMLIWLIVGLGMSARLGCGMEPSLQVKLFIFQSQVRRRKNRVFPENTNFFFF